jgi:hypothetical protein
MTSLDVRFDPALVQQALQGFLAQDPSVWAGIVGDPTRAFGHLVPTMDSAVLAMTAWDDFWFPASEVAATLSALPPGSPSKLYLGTVGHSTPPNVGERQFRVHWRRQWFDRFLKDDPNGIDAGPRITYAVTPADVLEYLSTSSAWQRVECDTWPPAGTFGYRLHVRAGANLWPFPADSPENPQLLHHAVAPGFGPAEMVDAEFRLPPIEAAIPRVAHAWTGEPLIAPLATAGEPLVHARVVASADEWQLAASLWDVAPDQTERFVASGSTFFDQPGSAGQERVVEFRLGSNAYVFPAGHAPRLKLENLHVHEPPVGQILRYAPTLHAYDLEIRHDAQGSTWIELPVAESASIPYGWSQQNSKSCVPETTASGTASATDPAPYWIEAADTLNNKDGLLVYGFAPGKSFLGGGFLWMAPPLRRTGLVHSGGNPPPDDCSGLLRFDFNARIRAGVDPALVVGTRVGAQFWSRDPASTHATNLTNAVEFSILP